jgi:hypothetical protein
MLPRVALLTAIHIVGAVLGVGVIWALMQTDDSLAASLVSRMINSPDALQRVREDSMGHVWLWCVGSILVGLVFAIAWVVLMERVTPVDADEARSGLGSWAGLFVLTVIGFVAVGYVQVVVSGQSAFLNPSAVAMGGLASLIITVLAYYLGTLVGVKRTMRLSVPFAPSF